MKQKDIVYLVLAAVILSAAGFLGFSALKPKGGGKTVTVEVVTPLTDSFNQDGLNALQDRSKAVDFYIRPDLTTGLNNPQPFGQ
jgi:hypothetical protein